MADDKTRTDVTESGSDEQDADRQVSVADRPVTRSSSTSEPGVSGETGETGETGESGEAGEAGKTGEAGNYTTSGATEAGGEPGSTGGTGSHDTTSSSGTASVHSGNDDSGSERSGSKPVRGVWRRLKRPAVLVSAALVLLLAASTAYLGFRVTEQNRAEADRAAQVAAAEKYALALTSYDFTSLQDNFGAVTGNATDRFGKQYKQVSDSLTQLIKQYRATSKGNVAEVGVISSDERKAVLALFVDQSVTNTNSPQPRVDRNRMKMTLVHSGDRWLLDNVQLV